MRVVLAFMAAVLLAIAPFSAPRAATGFTPAQRDEIVGILRDALKKDPSILRDALSALQEDEARRQDKVTRDVLALLGPRLEDPLDPIAGNPFGDVRIVEFYDTRCPYCRQMRPVMDALIASDPKIKLVLKDIPILGPASELESRALLAAQIQGGYFRLQEAIMRNGQPTSRDQIKAMADQLGMDGNRVIRDLDNPAIKARLANNVDLAKQIGIDGTPAFVIGTRLISGATDLKTLQAAVAEARHGP